MFASLRILLAFLLIEVMVVSTSPAADALAAKRDLGYETQNETRPQKSNYLSELKAVDRRQRQIRFKGSYQQLPKGLPPHQASEEAFAHHDDALSYFIQVDVEEEPRIDMNFSSLPKGTMTYFPPEVIPLDLLYSSEDDGTFGFLGFHDEHKSNVQDSREKAAKSQAGPSPFYIPPNEDIDYDHFFITHSSSAEELKPVFLAKDFSSVSTSTKSQPSVHFDSLEIGHHRHFDKHSVNVATLENKHQLNLHRPSVHSDSLEIEHHLNFDKPSLNLDPPEIHHHHHTVDRPSVNSDFLEVDQHHHVDRPSANSDSLELDHHHNFDKPSSENAPFHFFSDTSGQSDILLTNNVFEADENDRDFKSSYSTTTTLSTQPSWTTEASYSFPSQTTISDPSTAESGEIFFITGHSDNSNDAEKHSFSTTLLNSQPSHIASSPATIFGTSSSFLLPQNIPRNHGPNIQHQSRDITGPSSTSAHHHDIISPFSISTEHHDIISPSSTSAQHPDIQSPSPTPNLPKTLSITKIANPDLSTGLPKSHQFPSKGSRRKLSGGVTNQSISSKERASKEESSDGSIPGTPGTDYPLYHTVPVTSFDCSTREFGGYYADPETNCQAFHICLGRKSHGFLCPLGTMFNQKLLVCDWWYNVACVQDPQHPI